MFTRSQLQLEPRAVPDCVGGGAKRWQQSKKIIKRLNDKIRQLENERVDLKTEVL